MTYGRISFNDADALDRSTRVAQERRHEFRRVPPEPEKPSGRVCGDCNLRRTPKEFRIGDQEFLNCSNCWAKHGRKKRK